MTPAKDILAASYLIQEAAVHGRMAEFASIGGDTEKAEFHLEVMKRQFKAAATLLGLAFLEPKEVAPE